MPAAEGVLHPDSHRSRLVTCSSQRDIGMIGTMKWRKRMASVALACALAFPSAAFGDDTDNTHDARTEGYAHSVQIDGSTSLMWIGFIFVSIICMAALFKDSKRARTE